MHQIVLSAQIAFRRVEGVTVVVYKMEIYEQLFRGYLLTIIPQFIYIPVASGSVSFKCRVQNVH